MIKRYILLSTFIALAMAIAGSSTVSSSCFAQDKKDAVKEDSEAKKDATEKKTLKELSPTEVIKKYEAEMKAIVNKYNADETEKSEEKKNEEIISKVRDFFDIDELAKLSLGDHWKKITQKQRQDYSDTFRKLIERSYVSKSGKLVGDYDVKYTGEKIHKNKSEVMSKVLKDDADVDITYELHRKSSKWMIYNVIVDSTDLVKNYQTSFNSTITKEGFKGLLLRMKNKLTGSG